MGLLWATLATVPLCRDSTVSRLWLQPLVPRAQGRGPASQPGSASPPRFLRLQRQEGPRGLTLPPARSVWHPPPVCPPRIARCPSCPPHTPTLLSHHIQGTNGAQGSHVAAWGARSPRVLQESPPHPRLGVRGRWTRTQPSALHLQRPEDKEAPGGGSLDRRSCRRAPPFLHTPWARERHSTTQSVSLGEPLQEAGTGPWAARWAGLSQAQGTWGPGQGCGENSPGTLLEGLSLRPDLRQGLRVWWEGA